MSAPQRTWTLQAPPESVQESPNQQEERESRVSEMLVWAKKHPAKAELPADHAIACLYRMLDDLYREQASAPAASE